MSARKSNGPTKVITYRITEYDKAIIANEYGSLTEFLNKCIAKEINKLEKKLKRKAQNE